MNYFRTIIGSAVLLLVCWIAVFSQSATPFSPNEAPIPNNGQPVNDYADVIDDATEQQLNQKIKDFMARTNPPVALAVLTVKTTGDRPIEEYSLAVYRGWKIGAAGEDSPGALLMLAVDDRKYRTEISRDLEDELPDGLAGQLQRQYLVPALKQGNYAKGISDTIDAYIRTIDARTSGTTVSPTPQTEPTPRQRTAPVGSTSISRSACCFIILIILMIIIFSRAGGGGGGRNNRWGGGGGFGGALPWIIGSILANSGRSSGGGGSSWGGGDFGGGGGGGSWGGFGGGGDAGGGGAGGSW